MHVQSYMFTFLGLSAKTIFFSVLFEQVLILNLSLISLCQLGTMRISTACMGQRSSEEMGFLSSKCRNQPWEMRLAAVLMKDVIPKAQKGWFAAPAGVADHKITQC